MDGDSIAFLGCGTDGYGLFAPSGMRGAERIAGLRVVSGHRQQAREINEHLALPTEQLSAVVLSHAHIDHSGNLPLLVKQGYRGPIYTTPSTVDLCEKMLKDSAHIQESDAEFVNRRSHRRRSIGIAAEAGAVTPLYTQEDAAQAVQQFKPVTMHTPQVLAGSTADAGLYYDDV